MRLFFSIVFVFSSLLSSAQYEDNLTYGLKVGGVYSNIGNLPEMILGRDHQFTQSSINSKGKYGVEGGVFLNYKLPDTRTAIQPEILYRKSGAQVNYSNPIKSEEYQLDLNYSYLVFGATYKLYPVAGFNFGVGAYYSKNLTPHSLEYTSNVQGGLYDTNYRQFYRDGIVGRGDFSLSFSLGYELKNSFHFDVRYYLGVGDMISSRSTSFQFLENTNRNTFLTLSVGYSFHQW